jgi:hypothetical protein
MALIFQKTQSDVLYWIATALAVFFVLWLGVSIVKWIRRTPWREAGEKTKVAFARVWRTLHSKDDSHDSEVHFHGGAVKR